MIATPSSPLLHLSAAEVGRVLPPVDERIGLARRAMRALVSDAELPPKLGVHPRPDGSFAHAMPAYLRGDEPGADLLGIKWVAGFPTNTGLDLPAIHGTVLLSDPATGVPLAVMDAGPITAHRTAAVSGVAIDLWAPSHTSGGRIRVAMLGAGVQAHSHLPVVAHLLPGSDLIVHDRHPERAEAVCASALEQDFAEAVTARDAESAAAGADVVITMVSFHKDRQRLPPEALSDASLIVAVDYDMCVPAVVAVGAGLFAVDESEQFRNTRATGVFQGYPDPVTTIGQALAEPGDRGTRSDKTILVTHLGVGLADVVFADSLWRAAVAQGVGTLLAR